MRSSARLLALLLLLSCRTFQGRGYVTGTLFFEAVEGSGEGGASTILSVYDQATGTRHRICELGATGESTFAVNRERSLVAFNWFDGIYLVSFASETPHDCESWEKGARRIVACEACYEVRWRSARQLEYEENGQLRTYEVD